MKKNIRKKIFGPNIFLQLSHKKYLSKNKKIFIFNKIDFKVKKLQFKKCLFESAYRLF